MVQTATIRKKQATELVRRFIVKK